MNTNRPLIAPPQELDLSQLQQVAGGQSVPLALAEAPQLVMPIEPNPGGFPVL